MRDMANNTKPIHAVPAQSFTSSAQTSGDLDISGHDSATVEMFFGNITEMPGGGSIALKLEHADRAAGGGAGTYSDVEARDVVQLGASGSSSVTGGVVATATDDANPVWVGYVGDKAFLRVTMTPTGLTSGGPAGANVLLGIPRHGPVSAT